MGLKKKRNSKIGLFILCGALTVFILALFLSMNNITEIFAVVKTANGWYVFAAVGLLALYMVLSPLTLCLLARSKKTKVTFGNAYMIGMTEHFFNGITPFSTGGQPFQVYAFNKVKVKPSESTGLLLMNFIIHMIVTNVFAIASLAFYSRFIVSDASAMRIIAIVGFVMNFLVLIFMLALATSRRLSNALVKLLALFGKIKFLSKWIEPQVPKFRDYCDNVRAAFKELGKKVGTFFFCLIVKAVTMAAYYAITFYILRAMHVDISYADLFYVICGTSFAITMVVFLPTPGSSGGIEFAFKNIFASIAGVSSAVAYGGMLIWRLLSYYLVMLISLGFYVALEIYISKVWRPRYLAAHPEERNAERTETDLSKMRADAELPAAAGGVQVRIDNGEPVSALAGNVREEIGELTERGDPASKIKCETIENGVGEPTVKSERCPCVYLETGENQNNSAETETKK